MMSFCMIAKAKGKLGRWVLQGNHKPVFTPLYQMKILLSHFNYHCCSRNAMLGFFTCRMNRKIPLID